MTAIEDKYAALGGERGFLGPPAFQLLPLGFPGFQELPAGNGEGRLRHYVNGSIYWSPATGAHEVHGRIRARWVELGAEKGFLGYPLSDETVAADGRGRHNHFQGGSIHWSPETGAHEVHGAILEKWSRLGREAGVLGYPTTDELLSLDLLGRASHFQNGSIYWSQATGAHIVKGAIRDKWNALGAERGVLGYPVGDETAMPDDSGWFSDFQRGTICCSRALGTFEIHGAIRNKWAELGGIAGHLGYPTSDELSTPPFVLPTVPFLGEAGRFSTFQHGAVYWRPSLGAHAIYGLIHREWARNGTNPLPELGQPIADEQGVAGRLDRYSDCENGVVYWRSPTAQAVRLTPAAINRASKTKDEMVEAINAILVPKLKAANERVSLPRGGGVLFAMTDYAKVGGGVRNRMYQLRVDIDLVVEGTGDPTVVLDLWILVSHDVPNRRIVATVNSWMADTTVPFPTIFGISPSTINAQFKEALDPLVGVVHDVGAVPDSITVLSVKPRASGDLDIFIAPLA